MDKKEEQYFEVSVNAFVKEQAERFHMKEHQIELHLFAYLMQLIYRRGYVDGQADLQLL